MKRFLVLVCLSIPLALVAPGAGTTGLPLPDSAVGQVVPDSITCDPGEITLVSAPTLSAPNPVPGQAITSSPGSWTVCGNINYSGMWTEWRRDGVVMPGYPQWVPSSPTLGNFSYTIQSIDVGHVITSAIAPCNDQWGCYSPSVQSSNSVIPTNPPPPPPPSPDCYAGSSTAYHFETANTVFNAFGYRQVHLHDYQPNVTLSQNNFNEIMWAVWNDFSPYSGIRFFLRHDYLGRDVLTWETTSATGVVTTGTYGLVPPDIYLRVERGISAWDGYVTINGTDYWTGASVTPSDAGHAFLLLIGWTGIETDGDCNSMDMRFDGGSPGSASYVPIGPSPVPCGRPQHDPTDPPYVPLNCSKSVQIRFFN